MSEAESESDVGPPSLSSPLPLTASEERQVDQCTRIGLVATRKYPSDILTEDDRREMDAIRRSLGMLPRKSLTAGESEDLETEEQSTSVTKDTVFIDGRSPPISKRQSFETKALPEKRSNFENERKSSKETSCKTEMRQERELCSLREQCHKCPSEENREGTKVRSGCYSRPTGNREQRESSEMVAKQGDKSEEKRHSFGMRQGRGGLNRGVEKKDQRDAVRNCSKNYCRSRFGYHQARCSCLHSKYCGGQRRPRVWVTGSRLLVCSVCRQQMWPPEEHWDPGRGWYEQQLPLPPLFGGSHLLTGQRDLFSVRPRSLCRCL